MKATNEIYVNAASSRLLGTVRTKVKVTCRDDVRLSVLITQ